MSFYDELRKKLDPETFTKVTDALGDDFNFDLVPRTRLNKVIAQRNEAREELAKLQQGGASPDGVTDDDDDGGAEPPKDGKAKQQKAAGLTQKDLDDAVAAAKAEGVKQLKELQMRYAVTAKLQAANFTDPELVLSADLIDFTKIKTDDKGTITGGLDDQITSVATAKPFLVGGSGGGAPSGTGKAGGVDLGAITTREEFMKLDTAKQIEFKLANPEVFAGFMAQI